MQKDRIILGISGSIAAYKACDVASSLVKLGFDVVVVATAAALEFAPARALRALVGKEVIVFDSARGTREETYGILEPLVSDALVYAIVPASANTIAHIAHKQEKSAVDMCALLAEQYHIPKLYAPAMNTYMYTHPATQENLALLKAAGWICVEPVEGRLACKDEGTGKLAPVAAIVDAISVVSCKTRDLQGKTVVVSAGPTQEALDPVRYITNHSSGTMGFEVARRAAARGAYVVLISGPSALSTPFGVMRVDVTSAHEMFLAVQTHAQSADIIIMSAAVADFTPREQAHDKLKKDTFGEVGQQPSILLKPTQDILAWLGKSRMSHQRLVGFAMETKDLVKNAQAKLERKHADLIVANNLRDEGAGFGTQTNRVTFISKEAVQELPLMDKRDVADAIFNELLYNTPLVK